MPSNSVGLVEAFFQNKSGQTFTASESTRLIADNCPFPVYGVNANTFLHGIVGGRLKDGYFQGVEAARRALAILKGAAPGSLPLLRESINRFQFDYVQLQRWQIDSSLLPQGSLVLNRPVSLYQQHTTTIWIVAAFLRCRVRQFQSCCSIFASATKQRQGYAPAKTTWRKRRASPTSGVGITTC